MMIDRLQTYLARQAGLGGPLLAFLLVVSGPIDLFGGMPERRPYSPDSPWNVPIGPNAAVDRHSAQMIATLVDTGTGGAITSDPDQYSYPVYFVDALTPRHSVRCAQYKCTISTDGRPQRANELPDVPIPPELTPSTGSDGQVIIIDLTYGVEYNFWQIRREGEQWVASNGSTYSVFKDGAPSEYGSRGAGVPYYAGLVRPWEIDQGKIEHALAFAYPTPARDRCVYPASKTDGRSDQPFAIPEGARLQLDPSLTEADFRRWGLDRTGIIIAKALQQYGMYLIAI
jgi:hypothetical protein